MNHVDITKEPPVILSLCPGILGLERGLEGAIGPVRIAAYVEIEAFICENLVAAMEQGILAPAPIWTDLKTFDAQPFRGKLHGIIGGYPCQPFSRAGNRQGADDPRHLWPYIERIIETTGPVFCFFENVEGHLDLGYATVYASLRNMGYAVEAGIYSAEEAGAPHQRNRLFILAIKMGYAGLLGQAQRQKPATGVEQSGEEELGYADHTGSRAPGYGFDLYRASENQRQKRQPFSGVGGSGKDELADTNRTAAEFQEPSCSRQERECARTQQSEMVRQGDWQVATERAGTSCNDADMANTSEQYVQGYERSELDKKKRQEPRERQAGSQSIEHWPARPGEPQYDWEEPRTVEPQMGVSAHGYNFREDLLRALGNSVVPQTATIAFIDLLKKHRSNE